MLELEQHDHKHCVDQVLAVAERVCRERHVRLTEQRRTVLSALAQSHVPASAYDLLDRINRDRQDRGDAPLAPVSIYRALEFLSQQGLIHRIESRNAYVACLHGTKQHGSVTIFLLCDRCGKAGEFQSDALSGLVDDIARTEQFKANAPVLEIRGLCARCQAADRDH
jgi:Fur family transcriptional regulator, zinc uptake regulator